MADTKLTGLTEVSVPVVADVVYAVDVSDTTDDPAGTSRKLTIQRLLGAAPGPPGGRLTLSTGVPVADVGTGTTIYYTPYLNNVISLWDGTRWLTITFSEVSLALGTVTATLGYDVFAFLSSGALAIETLAWTSGAARATAVTLQDGRYCKSGDKTRLLLGSFYAITTTYTSDSTAFRSVSNVYNRVHRPLLIQDTTDSWNYSTASFRQANNSTTNQVDTFSTLGDTTVSLAVMGASKNGTIGATAIGIGENSTTANDASVISGVMRQQVTNLPINGIAFLNKIPAVGRNYYAWLERGSGGGTDTWLGDNSNPTFNQCGISGWIMN